MTVCSAGCQPRYCAFSSSHGSLDGPGFLGDLVGLDDADEIEQRAAAQVIANDVAVRPHEHRHHPFEQILRQPLGRHHGAPGRVAGVGRGRRAEHLRRAPPTSAHRRRSGCRPRRAAVGKVKLDAVGALGEAGHLVVEAHHVRDRTRGRERPAGRAGRRGEAACRARRAVLVSCDSEKRWITSPVSCRRNT